MFTKQFSVLHFFNVSLHGESWSIDLVETSNITVNCKTIGVKLLFEESKSTKRKKREEPQEKDMWSVSSVLLTVKLLLGLQP